MSGGAWETGGLSAGGSVLTGGLPDGVLVDGMRIPVETDYRAGLLYDALLRDRSLPDGVRASLIVEFACGQVPDTVDREKLLAALARFYAMGKDAESSPAAIPQQIPLNCSARWFPLPASSSAALLPSSLP